MGDYKSIEEKKYVSELKGREEDLTECLALDFAQTLDYHTWCSLGILLCTHQKEYINVAHYRVYKWILITRQDLKLLRENLRNHSVHLTNEEMVAQGWDMPCSPSDQAKPKGSHHGPETGALSTTQQARSHSVIH